MRRPSLDRSRLDALPGGWRVEILDERERVADLLDPATLRVRGRAPQSGAPAEVSIRLGNRIPYILIGPDRALEYVTERTKTLVAR